MELHYGLKQPLRFSTNINHRNNAKLGGSAKVFKTIAPTNYLLPFQLQRDSTPVKIQSIKYISTEDASETEVISSIVTGQIEILHFAGYDQIIHFGSQALGVTLPAGDYYLEITDSGTTWYSEDLRLIDFDPEDLTTGSCVLTKIEYWDTCNIDNIYYKTVAAGFEQYKQVIYLDVDVGAPEYEYDSDGDEDGNTVFVPEYIKLEKVYQLQGVFPEYMVDALSLLPLHISKTATVNLTSWRGFTGKMNFITMNPEWQGSTKTWAVVDLEFITTTILKTNCCDNEDALFDECLYGGLEVVATVVENSTDHLNFQYTSAATGNPKVLFQNGDLLIIENASGDFNLAQYDSSSYSLVAGLYDKGQVITDTNELNGDSVSPVIYYYYKSVIFGLATEPTIESIVSYSGPLVGDLELFGCAWNGAAVSIYAELSTGPDVLIKTVLSENMNSGSIVFTRPANATGIYIEVSGLTCDLGTSSIYALAVASGIGNMDVGSTFIVS